MSKESVNEMVSMAIRAFQHEGGVNLEDIEKLLAVALEDNVMDPKERKALHQFFHFCREEDVTPEVWQKIQEVTGRYEV